MTSHCTMSQKCLWRRSWNQKILEFQLDLASSNYKFACLNQVLVCSFDDLVGRQRDWSLAHQASESEKLLDQKENLLFSNDQMALFLSPRLHKTWSIIFHIMEICSFSLLHIMESCSFSFLHIKESCSLVLRLVLKWELYGVCASIVPLLLLHSYSNLESTCKLHSDNSTSSTLLLSFKGNGSSYKW